MSRLLLLAGVVLFVGCTEGPAPAHQPAAWRVAAETYRCTPEQMEQVIRETKACDENTDFFGSFCWGTAMWRNCAPSDGGQP